MQVTAPSLGLGWARSLAVAFAVIVFAQNPPWPVWDYQIPLLTLGVMAGLLLTLKDGADYFRGGYLGFFVIAGGFVYFFLLHGLAGSFRMSSAIFAMTVLLIFRCDARTGALAFDLVSRVFAVILAVSLVFWVLWQLGLPLPSAPLSYGAWKGDDGLTQLDNYYFFVAESQTLLNRFYSVFDEPGVVGTLAAFILCGLRFDFSRKRAWPVLAGGLFAWSLAFVVLSVTGVMLFRRGRKLKWVLAGILGTAALVLVAVLGSMGPSDDSAGLLLLYRIAHFSENGVGSRTDEKLNEYFFEYLRSLRVLFGEGTSFFQQRPDLLSGQGAIFYVTEYGLLGMAVLVATYVAILWRFAADRMQGYLLLVLFLMSFLQRPHLMTPWQLVLFWTVLCIWGRSESLAQSTPAEDR